MSEVTALQGAVSTLQGQVADLQGQNNFAVVGETVDDLYPCSIRAAARAR